MLVCICKGVSDKDIKKAIHEGATGFRDVSVQLGVGSCCGQCAPYARELITESITEIQTSQTYSLAYELAF